MNANVSKNSTRRARERFGWLLQDWVWEVVLVLLVAPVVVDSLLTLGPGGIA